MTAAAFFKMHSLRRGRPSSFARYSNKGRPRAHPQRKAPMAEQHAIAPGHADSAAPEATLPGSHHKASFWTLTLGAIGVVYGDIGTSPLYAMRETVAAATGGHHGTPVPLTRELVISILSLLLWALILTVSV